MDRQAAKRRGPPRVVIIAFCLLAVLIPAVGWWLRNHTFWTDGRSTRVAASDNPTRRVIWTPARPLAAPTTAPSNEPVYDPFLTPDTSQLYFVRGKPGTTTHARVFRCRRVDDRWLAPESVDALNLAGYDSLGPRVTADGRFLLFSSNRPGGLGGFDLWAAPRKGDGGWATPFNLGPAVNSEFDEYNPDPTPDGTRLIFTTNRTAAKREQLQAWAGTIRQATSADFDLWIAHVAAQPATAPTTAPSLAYDPATEIRGLNTPFTEGASCLSPAGDFLYFASNRPGGFGKFDLYRSRVHDGDVFDPPENLGAAVNSAANDADPTLAYDGFRMAFSSDRGSSRGDYQLYTSDSREVFPDRELPRFAMPSLRLGYGTLLLSALLILPLIFLLRNARSRALTTLQRCLVLSLLLHAVAAFVCSFITVTRAAMGGGRPGREVTVPINLAGGGAEATIATSIRGQLSLDPADATAGSEALSSPLKTVAGAAEIRRVSAPTALRATDLRQELSRLPASAQALPLQQAAIIDAARLPTAAPSGPAPVAADVPTVTRAAAHATEPAASGTDLATNLIRVERPTVFGRTAPPTTVPSSSITVARSPSMPLSDRMAFDRLNGPSIAGRDVPAPPRIEAAPVAENASGPSHHPTATRSNDLATADEVGRQVLTASTRPSQAPTAGAGGSERAVVQATLPPHTIGGPHPAEAAAQVSGFQSPSPRPIGTATKPSLNLNAITPDAAVPLKGIGRHETVVAAADGAAQVAVAGGKRSSSTAQQPSRPALSVALAPVAMIAVPSAAPAFASGLTPPPVPLTTAPVRIAVASVGGSLGPPDMPAPEAAFPRAENVRHQRVQSLGGNAASEEAVDHALAYLARQQEPTGRWTIVTDGSSPAGQRPPHPHDAACTGLALLTFLARNHSPAEAGPYRDVVTRGLDFLVSIQTSDGDLRGPREFRGPGSERADLYDHAIATLALAEAAAMSGDRRYTDAALAGARFIVACQDARGGGWRYSPLESGDTSVFGWQIMALHAAERLGFAIPDATRALAIRYVERARAGERGALGCYRPGQSPTPAMTAELLYARQLLDQPAGDDEVREAAVFFAQPSGSQVDLYCWYYGSLSLVQSPSRELWNVWNPVVRDTLVGLQHRDDHAEDDGSWDTNFRWASRGGRVFSTALATLTLEVYYRYETPSPPAAGANGATPASR